MISKLFHFYLQKQQIQNKNKTKHTQKNQTKHTQNKTRKKPNKQTEKTKDELHSTLISYSIIVIIRISGRLMLLTKRYDKMTWTTSHSPVCMVCNTTSGRAGITSLKFTHENTPARSPPQSDVHVGSSPSARLGSGGISAIFLHDHDDLGDSPRW